MSWNINISVIWKSWFLSDQKENVLEIWYLFVIDTIRLSATRLEILFISFLRLVVGTLDDYKSSLFRTICPLAWNIKRNNKFSITLVGTSWYCQHKSDSRWSPCETRWRFLERDEKYFAARYASEQDRRMAKVERATSSNGFSHSRRLDLLLQAE